MQQLSSSKQQQQQWQSNSMAGDEWQWPPQQIIWKREFEKCNSHQQQVQQRPATVIMSKAQWSPAAVAVQVSDSDRRNQKNSKIEATISWQCQKSSSSLIMWREIWVHGNSVVVAFAAQRPNDVKLQIMWKATINWQQCRAKQFTPSDKWWQRCRTMEMV